MRAVGKQLLGVVFKSNLGGRTGENQFGEKYADGEYTGEFKPTESGYSFNTDYKFMGGCLTTTAGVLKLVGGKYRVEFETEGTVIPSYPKGRGHFTYLEIETDEQGVKAVLAWTHKHMGRWEEGRYINTEEEEPSGCDWEKVVDRGRWEKVSIVQAQMLAIMQKESAMMGYTYGPYDLIPTIPAEFRESSRGRSLEVHVALCLCVCFSLALSLYCLSVCLSLSLSLSLVHRG